MHKSRRKENDSMGGMTRWQCTDNIIHIPKITNIPANSTSDFFLLLYIVLFSLNHQIITRHKPKNFSMVGTRIFISTGFAT